MGRDIKGAEIFAVGTWNGSSFSEQDLDGIVSAFDFFQMSGQVPLKFGHNDSQPVTDGQPALGWVDRVYRQGKKLFADFRDVPTVVYDLIKSGAYKFVSVELLRNVTAGTRQVPLVLDAVALLGADPPAVGTLKDLQALTMSAFREKCEARLAFTHSFNSGERKTMADDNTELEQLRAQLDAAKRAEAEAKAAAAANAERFSRLDAETKKEKTDAHRKEVKAMLENAVRDKKIQASARERFERLFKVDTDAVNDIRIPDVEAYIRENPNPFLKQNATTVTGGDPDAIPVGGMPDKELMARARKLCRDRGKDPENWEHLRDASIAVMRADPSLAEKYRQLPDDHADGKYEAA